MFLTSSVRGIFIEWQDGLLSGRQRCRQGGLHPAKALARFSSGSDAISSQATAKVQAVCSKTQEGGSQAKAKSRCSCWQHLRSPNLSILLPLPSAGASLGHVSETRGSHRASSTATSTLSSSSQPPKLWTVIHAVALQSHQKLPGDDTSPSPVARVISAASPGEPP